MIVSPIVSRVVSWERFSLGWDFRFVLSVLGKSSHWAVLGFIGLIGAFYGSN